MAPAAIPADDPFWQLTIGDPGPARLFDAAVYYRGGLTVHALRLQIGDEKFFELLRTWVHDNAGGNVTTDQFIALAEQISVHTGLNCAAEHTQHIPIGRSGKYAWLVDESSGERER